MILVRMGEHDAEKVAALLHQIADVRQDEIDAGQVVAGERHAEIDRDPLPAALVAEARRARDSCRSRRPRRAARTRAHRWDAAIACSDQLALAGKRPSAGTRRRPRWSRACRRQTQHQAAGLIERLEAAATSRSARRTRTSSPTPAARASQSARMVAKPSPPFHCARRPSILARERGEQRLAARPARRRRRDRSPDSRCRPDGSRN